ncbi:pseudouridine synthase [Uliginosibacterium gangwonense]|uniref:pseudouridine synthase n=1 Tax=Uliginosibacterium gangwonense TaxID=392736 RepID=UPI000376E20B|nr:pseudouridine synthase [Uliginosibacterium gangwonense]
MSKLVLLNKPFGVLSQFTGEAAQRTLAEFVTEKNVYAAGRLDADSEGLLLLTDDGALQHALADPRHKAPKTYYAQVEGSVEAAALQALQAGLDLGDFKTLPCQAEEVAEPAWLWLREPPIRFRKAIPTSWLKIVIREGKNRQVRRMTAKVGLPTLRLVRWSIGQWSLGDLQPGQSRTETVQPPAPDAARVTRRRAR